MKIKLLFIISFFLPTTSITNKTWRQTCKY